MVRLLVSSRSVHYASPVDRQSGPPPRFPDERREEPERSTQQQHEPFGIDDDGTATGTVVTGRVASAPDGAAVSGVVVAPRERRVTAVPGGMVVGDAYDSFVLSAYSTGSVLGLAVIVAIGIGLYFMLVRYAGSLLAAIAPVVAALFALFLGWVTRAEMLVFDHRNGCVWVVSRRLAMHCFNATRKHRTAYGQLRPPEVVVNVNDVDREVLQLALAGAATRNVGDVTAKTLEQRAAMVDAWRQYIGDLQHLNGAADDAGDGHRAVTVGEPTHAADGTGPYAP
uniref:Uncharacterized protein n=1 Tax=Neobodo designis TaxID=312471 RepID=A0A7S1QIN2_NEODS|mmetsp:Transcript_4643/g.14724  ORF Transcript_4643/g.14724 Transcript_4643/m.14724 type:complete len:282 (+) Transcript_4643:103-948(+)